MHIGGDVTDQHPTVPPGRVPIGAKKEEIEHGTVVMARDDNAMKLRAELAPGGLAAHFARNLIAQAWLEPP